MSHHWSPSHTWHRPPPLAPQNESRLGMSLRAGPSQSGRRLWTGSTRALSRKVRSLGWRVRTALSPEQIASFRLQDGSRFDYPLKSVIGWSLATRRFETAEVDFALRHLKPGDVFVDVAANGGLFALVAARRVGHTGRVFAFEPAARELELLAHNVRVNDAGNVTIIRKAVGDRSGTARLGISADGAMSSLAKTDHPGQHIVDWQTVEMVTLDEFCLDQGVERVDFLKVDVEGAERLVFAGARRTLQQNPHAIILFEGADVNAAGFGYTVRELFE